MSEQLNVYTLGSAGVNVTKSPLHHDDGELLSAQNAEFTEEAGLGGLRKRPGLVRLNTSVLAGTVGGVIGVPLNKRSVYVTGGTTWYSSSDGSTFAAVSLPVSFPDSHSGQPGVMFRNRLHYGVLAAGANIGLGVTPGVSIVAFDGTAEYEIARVAATAVGNVSAIFPHNDKLYFAYARANENAEVFEWDNGTVRLVATAFDPDYMELPSSGVSAFGKIWVGTARGAPGTATGRIHSARPNDAAWVTERTAGAGHVEYVSLATYNGELFAGTKAAAGTAAIVEKRTTAGVWSTGQTGSGTAEDNRFKTMLVFGGNLYAFYTSAAGTTSAYKYDGSSWTLDQDLTDANYFTTIKGAAVIGNTLWVGGSGQFGGGLWKKVGSTWTSVVMSNLEIGSFGVIGGL